MKIKIEILGSSSKSNCLKDILEPALKREGFESLSDFARHVAERLETNHHAEVACISRVMLGQTSRLEPKKASAYSAILGIPLEKITSLGGIGNYRKPKPLIIDDGEMITEVVQKLAKKGAVSIEDLVKELLYLSHR